MSPHDTPCLLIDESEHGPAAGAMIDQQLRARGIDHPRVLHAMRRIPRHAFIAPELNDRAYEDSALPTLNGQTISQPYMVAAMTEALDPQPGDRVLEIGTGSGYQTMILALLADRVVSVERDPQLARFAEGLLDHFGVDNVSVVCGDGSLGWPADAPYQRILVTAGAPEVPAALVDQLAIGGRLVAPVGDREQQRLVTIDRDASGLRRREGISCRFVPLIGEDGWPTD